MFLRLRILTVCCDRINILGLSERLEVQEMFENLQEERLDNLQDDLVTCINGEEGHGGEASLISSEHFINQS